MKSVGTGLDDADLGGWCRLLNEAALGREVPDALHNPILEEAMNVLNEFRTDVHLNQIYRGRQEYERAEAILAAVVLGNQYRGPDVEGDVVALRDWAESQGSHGRAGE